MSYLEEFIKANKNLPEELRNELLNIEELDSIVQNTVNEMDKQFYVFFQNATTLNSENRDLVFQSLLSQFRDILEIADEKVEIAEWLEKTLKESLDKLDRKIVKLKTELEDGNFGITTIIQQRVLVDNGLINHKIYKDKMRKVKKCNKNEDRRITRGLTYKLGLDEILKKAEAKIDSKSIKINNGKIVSSSDKSYSEDSTLYCICNQMQFGNMIACDNKLCPYEWFHYNCIRMSKAPEGKWYCPKCKVCKVSLERL